MMKNFNMKFLAAHFPIKAFFWAIGIWLVLAGLNFASLEHWKRFTGADIFFPFSVIYPSAFLPTGALFALLFLLLGIGIYCKLNKIPVVGVLFGSIILVLLGNMAQGNVDIAFEQPFYLKGRQYYADAINIQNPMEWLRTFIEHQGSFQMHTNTHPPFVVLLHYYILEVLGGSILGLGIVFFLISSLFFFIFNGILKNLDFSPNRRKELLLLSAVVPSVNIYLLVSIDGIILMTSTLMLLAISRIYKTKKIDFLSFLYAFLSILFTNMLSFSGLFLFAFIGLYALYFMWKRDWSHLWFTIILFLWYILAFVVFYIVFGYNHLQTFLHASSSENPRGFMLFFDAYIYFWTRLQAVGEILMFLSLGITALLFSKKKYSEELFSTTGINAIFFSAIAALCLMFLSGAYGTGETARACLFIVPFFLILFKKLRAESFHIIYFLCLFQAFGMQLIGNFFW